MTNARTYVLCLLIGLAWSPAVVADPPTCSADIDADQVVGPADLRYLLGAWGSNDHAVDFDTDGEVACFDLEFLLGNWGLCPDLDVNNDGNVDTHDQDVIEANDGLDCSADLNHDGMVDQDDVDAFLCRFGAEGPIGDLDQNGFVQAADLTLLLGAFGHPCECDLNQDSVVDHRDVEVLTEGIGK